MKNISKKFLSLLISICMVVSVFPLTASAAGVSKSWHYVGDSGFSEENYPFGSQVVLDSGDNPYVIYMAENSLIVKKYNGERWESVGDAIPSVADGYTLAVNHDGTPYVAYRDAATSKNAYVVKYADSGWEPVGSALTTEGASSVGISTIAFNSRGTPYIAYQFQDSASNTWKAAVKKFNGSSWESVGSDNLSGTVNCTYSSIGFDSDDTLYTCMSNDRKPIVLKYMGGWNQVGGSDLPNVVKNLSFTISENTLYLAYTDFTNNCDTTVKKCRAGSNSWAAVGDPYPDGYSGADYLSLAAGGSALYLLQITRVDGEGVACIKELNGTSWENVGDLGSDSPTSLAAGSDDTPYIAYSDNANAGAISLKEYSSSECTVSYAAGAHGTLSSSDPETVTSGDSPSHVPTVTPEDGYSFAGWSSDGGTTLHTDLSGVAISSDITYNAYYSRIFSHNAVWQPVGTPGFSGGSATYESLVIDSTNTPYVAYKGSNGNAVMKYTSGSWQAVQASDSSIPGYYSIYPTLALDGNNTPYVAYQAMNQLGSAVVQKYTGSSWQTVGNLSSGQANYISMAIGSDGAPYVAYQDSSLSKKLIVKKFCGGPWQNLGSTSGISAGQADYISFALDHEGTPYAAYKDGSNGGKATVMEYDGNSWQTVGTAGISQGTANYTSLAIGSDDKPMVAYEDVANGGRTTVMKYDGASWVPVGNIGFSGGDAPCVSLAIDSEGTPYVAYQDCANDYKATVMKFNGTSWETAGNADFSAGSINFTSLAFDREGTPYVVYQDNGNNGDVTVMKLVEPSTCTVTYSVGDHGSLSGSTTETVVSGGCPQSVPTVTPNAGYIFSGWSCDGGSTLLTDEDLCEQEITADITYTAYYSNSCWEDVGTPGFTPGEADNVSSVMDKNGAIYAAFDDRTNSDAVSVMKYSPASGTWSALGSPLPGTYQPSIALDSSGTPYVVYYEGDANQISVAKYTGAGSTGWETVGASEFTGSDNIQDFHLTMCGNTPYVAYTYLAEDANKVGVMKYDGTNWVQVGTKGFSSSYRVSIQINSKGTPYVAISDLSSDNMATVLKYTGGGTSGWETVGRAGFSSSFISHISLAFSPNDTPYVCYDAGRILLARSLQESVPRISRVMKYTGSGSTGWEIVGSNSFTDLGPTKESFLTIDTDGTPYVVFEIGSTDWKLNVRKFDGTAWSNVGNANFSAGEAQFPSLMLRDGIPYVVYQDMAASGKATSKRLISYTVTYQAGQHGRITGSENEAVFPNGHPAHIPAATPDSGYTFAGWSRDGGTTLLTGAQLAAANINANVTYTAYFAAHSTPGGSSSSGTTTATKPAEPSTQTQVNPAGNTATVTTVADSVTTAGDTAQITATVTNITTDTTGTNATLNTGAAARVEIELPKDAIEQQLAAKRDVDLTLTVPHSVTQGANSDLTLDINAAAEILAAAKASGTDLTIHIKDADTQQVTYTWTFRGADLAASTNPVVDVNVSMAIRLTTEVPQVNRVTPDRLGLVLIFDHSGVLPSTAHVTFSAKEKGFKPGQKLYFYYYNTKTGQIESQSQEYTVDADGNVTVDINHCSSYVLLPNLARTITLDTRSYTMAPGQSYITGVKLAGVSGVKIKAYSSTKGVADVTVLKNGNVKVTGAKTGLTYIMIDVYDGKNKLLTHASVRLTVKSIVKPSGNSARQYGIF